VSANTTEIRSGHATEGKALAMFGESLLVAGTEFRPAGMDTRLFVARFRSDRTLDESFGDHGVAFGEVANVDVTSVVADPEQGITVAGTAVSSDQRRDAFVARFTSGGTLNPAFGTNGVAWGGFPNEPTDVQVFSLGSSIAVAGSVQGPSVNIVRLNATGKLDPSFGTGGRLNIRVSKGTYLVTTDRILVAGATLDAFGNESGHGTLRAYRTTGQTDTAFGQAGTVDMTTPVRLGAIDKVGRILTITDHFDEANAGYSLGRLLKTGTPDKTFGGGGTTDVVRGGSPFVQGIASRGEQIYLLVNYRNDTASVRRFTGDGVFQNDQPAEGTPRLDGDEIVSGAAYIAVVGTRRQGDGESDPRYAAAWWPEP
jgi:uncharacterized delta-60 repeat protein